MYVWLRFSSLCVSVFCLADESQSLFALSPSLCVYVSVSACVCVCVCLSLTCCPALACKKTCALPLRLHWSSAAVAFSPKVHISIIVALEVGSLGVESSLSASTPAVSLRRCGRLSSSPLLAYSHHLPDNGNGIAHRTPHTTHTHIMRDHLASHPSLAAHLCPRSHPTCFH